MIGGGWLLPSKFARLQEHQLENRGKGIVTTEGLDSPSQTVAALQWLRAHELQWSRKSIVKGISCRGNYRF